MRANDRSLETAYAKLGASDCDVMPKNHQAVFNSPAMYLDGAAGGGFQSVVGGPRNLDSSGIAYAISGGRTTTAAGARRLSQARSHSAIDEATLKSNAGRVKSPQPKRDENERTADNRGQRNGSQAVHDLFSANENAIGLAMIEEKLSRPSGKPMNTRTDRAVK